MTLEITFHPGTYADIETCLTLDHTCETDRVWQMTLPHGDLNVYGVTFKQEFLPRPVELTHQIARHRLYDNPDSGRLWVVARKYEPVPDLSLEPEPLPVPVEYGSDYDSDNPELVLPPPPPPRPPGIGYVVARYDDSQEIVWIDDLAVAPALRRKRVATRLVDGVRQWAREQGAHHLLVALPTKHVPMIQLVTALGLRFCGYSDHYFPNHDIAVFFGLRLARRGRVE
jgi:GNAT superfamily N-acetyltransferase